jgi:hypothetical protein
MRKKKKEELVFKFHKQIILLNKNNMAGHYPLRKEEEPKLFKIVDRVKNKIAFNTESIKDFEKFNVTEGMQVIINGKKKNKEFEVMKLSKDYVENPETELAFAFGPVDIESITDEHESLTHNISVEVHLILNKQRNAVAIKDIFWVA